MKYTGGGYDKFCITRNNKFEHNSLKCSDKKSFLKLTKQGNGLYIPHYSLRNGKDSEFIAQADFVGLGLPLTISHDYKNENSPNLNNRILLKLAGHYRGKIDGSWGPKSKAARIKFLEAHNWSPNNRPSSYEELEKAWIKDFNATPYMQAKARADNKRKEAEQAIRDEESRRYREQLAEKKRERERRWRERENSAFASALGAFTTGMIQGANNNSNTAILDSFNHGLGGADFADKQRELRTSSSGYSGNSGNNNSYGSSGSNSGCASKEARLRQRMEDVSSRSSGLNICGLAKESVQMYQEAYNFYVSCPINDPTGDMKRNVKSAIEQSKKTANAACVNSTVSELDPRDCSDARNFSSNYCLSITCAKERNKSLPDCRKYLGIEESYEKPTYKHKVGRPASGPQPGVN